MAFIKLRESDMTQLIENVSRRDLLKGLGVVGGFILAASLPLPRPVKAADAPKFGRDGMPHGWVNNPKVFVAIAPDGTVSIVCHRSDMGQGVRTGMPLIVADEMEARVERGVAAGGRRFGR